MAEMNLNHIMKSHRRFSAWKKLYTGAACLVVFVTTYLLILPALTLESNLICTTEEHTHTEACYVSTQELSCTEEESVGHTHSEACYGSSQILICGLSEYDGHYHNESCYDDEGNLICGMEESAGHHHDESCYGYESYLTCTLEESEGHTHTEECYEEKTELVCDKEEHTHGDDCYEQLEKGDPNADVESAGYWQSTFAHVTLTGDWSKDVVAIAETQLGYSESTRNFVYNEKKQKKGYTRYGAWYGDPYGDWCAMFASFCIRYGGVSSTYMPISAGCQNWIDQLKQWGMYQSKSTGYVPKPGDLVFYKNDSESTSGHVGIVYKVYSDGGSYASFTTIEGNSGNTVRINSCETTSGRIVGYGVLPENPALVKETVENEETEVIETEAAEDSESTENAEETEETEVTEIEETVDAGTAETEELETEVTEIEETETDTEEIAETEETEVTETEETEVPETEETESTETEGISEFVFEDESLIVTATLPEEAAMPETTDFNVDNIGVGTDEHSNVRSLLEAYAASQGYTLLDYVVYDMHFEQEGEEVEPEANVQVAVAYKETVQLSGMEKLESGTTDVRIFHLAENGGGIEVVDVTQEVLVNAANEIEAASFETDSFSDIVIATVTTDRVNGADWAVPGSPVSLTGVLGNAINYGIVADTIEKQAHMDSTFAINHLIVEGDGGNVTTGAYTNEHFGGAYWVGDVDGFILRIDGSSTVLYCPDDARQYLQLQNGTYVTKTKEEVNTYVNGMLSYTTAQSNAMAAQQTTKIPASLYSTLNNGSENNCVDLTQLPGGTYYLDGAVLLDGNVSVPAFKLREDQNIVFNFDETDIQIGRYVVYLQKADGTTVRYSSTDNNDLAEPAAERMFFNMPNCVNLKMSGGVLGVFLAPKATLYTLAGTSSGWLIVDTIHQNESEWHYIHQELPEIVPVSTGFKAMKTVNGAVPTSAEIFQFLLEEWNGSSWNLIQTKTNSGAMIEFDDISFDEQEDVGTHWYRVTESQTPVDGIALSTAQYLYKVEIGSVLEGETTTLTKKVTSYKVNAGADPVSGGTIDESVLTEVDELSGLLFENRKNQDTELVIDKKWLGSDGRPLSDDSIPDQITVRLLQKCGEETTLYGEYQVKKSENWTLRISNLPLVRADADGSIAEYSYYIEETTVTGFYTSYDGNDSIDGITSGKIVIRNKKGVIPPVDTETQVTVTKKWFSDTEEITDKTGNISFDLYQLPVQKEEKTEPKSYQEGDVCVRIGYGNYSVNSYTDYYVPVGTIFKMVVTKGSPEARVHDNNFWNPTAYLDYTEEAGGFVYTYVAVEDKYVGIMTRDNDNRPVTISYILNDEDPDPGTSLAYTEEELLAMGAEKKGTYTLYSDNDWTKTIRFKGQLGYSYKYYVIEKSQNNYEVSYEGQGTKDILIKNKVTSKTYELPETGGMGTKPITMLGILLILLSTAGLMIID